VAQAPRPRCAMVKVRREDPVNELCLTVYKSLLLVHIGLTDVSCRRTYVHHLHCMLHSTDMSKNRQPSFFSVIAPRLQAWNSLLTVAVDQHFSSPSENISVSVYIGSKRSLNGCVRVCIWALGNRLVIFL